MTTPKFCNEVNVSLNKMAVVSGHKLTAIRKGTNGKLMCKLDGKNMTTGEARQWLLNNYSFVNSQGIKVE